MPTLDNRSSSFALSENDALNTRIGAAIAPGSSQHKNKSGIHLLGNPRDAFAARMLLAATAERTLDVQYYIWHADSTGHLLLGQLHDAAERGVRVRLLLDDNGTAGLDAELSVLAKHPNIEVRLFNPFLIRKAKWLGYVTHFGRANRRMHNKSFTADNSATVIGGRNIGDEYFGATSGVLKQDLDLLAIGSVVKKVSHDFDQYWASQSAYPVKKILAAVTDDQANNIIRFWKNCNNDPKRKNYIDEIKQTTFVQDLLDNQLPLEWAPTKMVSDDPAKGLGKTKKESLLIHRLAKIIG